eukprot:gene16107-22249_t
MQSALMERSANRVAVSARRTQFAHAPFTAQQTRRHIAVARSASEDDIVRVATVGDMVAIHYDCKDPEGKIMDSSREEGSEALVFELGAGDVVGNKLFQGFDEAIRGMAVGQSTVLEATGGDWNKELLFLVPRDHPEVARLEGRYKSQGGLKEGMIIELANQSLAVCVSMNDDAVVIDANNMMAGKQLTFELELMGIQKVPLVCPTLRKSRTAALLRSGYTSWRTASFPSCSAIIFMDFTTMSMDLVSSDGNQDPSFQREFIPTAPFAPLAPFAAPARAPAPAPAPAPEPAPPFAPVPADSGEDTAWGLARGPLPGTLIRHGSFDPGPEYEYPRRVPQYTLGRQESYPVAVSGRSVSLIE